MSKFAIFKEKLGDDKNPKLENTFAALEASLGGVSSTVTIEPPQKKYKIQSGTKLDISNFTSITAGELLLPIVYTKNQKVLSAADINSIINIDLSIVSMPPNSKYKLITTRVVVDTTSKITLKLGIFDLPGYYKIKLSSDTFTDSIVTFNIKDALTEIDLYPSTKKYILEGNSISFSYSGYIIPDYTIKVKPPSVYLYDGIRIASFVDLEEIECDIVQIDSGDKYSTAIKIADGMFNLDKQHQTPVDSALLYAASGQSTESEVTGKFSMSIASVKVWRDAYTDEEGISHPKGYVLTDIIASGNCYMHFRSASELRNYNDYVSFASYPELLLTDNSFTLAYKEGSCTDFWVGGNYKYTIVGARDFKLKTFPVSFNSKRKYSLFICLQPILFESDLESLVKIPCEYEYSAAAGIIILPEGYTEIPCKVCGKGFLTLKWPSTGKSSTMFRGSDYALLQVTEGLWELEPERLYSDSKTFICAEEVRKSTDNTIITTRLYGRYTTLNNVVLKEANSLDLFTYKGKFVVTRTYANPYDNQYYNDSALEDPTNFFYGNYNLVLISGHENLTISGGSYDFRAYNEYGVYVGSEKLIFWSDLKSKYQTVKYKRDKYIDYGDAELLFYGFAQSSTISRYGDYALINSGIGLWEMRVNTPAMSSSEYGPAEQDTNTLYSGTYNIIKN